MLGVVRVRVVGGIMLGIEEDELKRAKAEGRGNVDSVGGCDKVGGVEGV